MINQIIDGIVNAIYEEFGSEYEIYTEDIEQGLEEPCFSVVCVTPRIERKLGNRYLRKNLFAIYYFSESKTEAKKECFEVEERLIDILELIEVDGNLVRGKIQESEILDGVLAFYIRYDLIVQRNNEYIPNMQTMDEEIKAKR